MQRRQHEKSYEIKCGSPEVAVKDNGKNCNNSNSDEFGTNFPKLQFLKILLLSYYHSHFRVTTLDFITFFSWLFLHGYYHSHFWVTTLDFITFFSWLFLHGPHFFIAWLFCVDINDICSEQRLFANYCLVYFPINSSKDLEIYQDDLLKL